MLQVQISIETTPAEVQQAEAQNKNNTLVMCYNYNAMISLTKRYNEMPPVETNKLTMLEVALQFTIVNLDQIEEQQLYSIAMQKAIANYSESSSHNLFMQHKQAMQCWLPDTTLIITFIL